MNSCLNSLISRRAAKLPTAPHSVKSARRLASSWLAGRRQRIRPQETIRLVRLSRRLEAKRGGGTPHFAQPSERQEHFYVISPVSRCGGEGGEGAAKEKGVGSQFIETTAFSLRHCGPDPGPRPSGPESIAETKINFN